MEQAKCHADYLSGFINRTIGIKHKVVPVVALPGWYIDGSLNSNKVLVINPKRGHALLSFVNRNILSKEQVDLIANNLEQFARSVKFKSDITDPDGADKYNYLGDRKSEEHKLS